MTETLDPTMKEALALIDRGLGDMQQRELVSTNEVSDLLLDVRLLLSSIEIAGTEELTVPETELADLS